MRRRIVDVKASELRALFYACGYFFCILASYYVIRPLRDEMAVAGGIENLPWLFTGTLVTMLSAQPLFATLVARMPRMRFISLSYRFFVANLLLFLLLFKLASSEENIWLGRVFYIWTSVFNLFVVSIFWAFIVDSFSKAQGKRLFGFIAFGGTLGGVIGSAATALLAETLGPVNLLAGSAVLIELGVLAARRMSRSVPQAEQDGEKTAPSSDGQPASSADDGLERPIGGTSLAGIRNVLRSPYLLGIAAYMFLFTTTATFLYFQQAELVAATYSDRALRTVFFARIDLAVNLITMFTQVFLTGRLIRWLGVGISLAILPLMSVAGFGILTFTQQLTVIIVFQVLRRSCNYAVARPAREVLYTVVPREDKYKAKCFNDTFVYRAGDQIGAWLYAGLSIIGKSGAAVPLTAFGLSLLWSCLAFWLGKKQRGMS